MRFYRTVSLSTQLGLLFALAATLIFVGVGTYLYQSMAAQLEAHNEQELLRKIGQIRHLLKETVSEQAIQNNPHRFINAVSGHNGLILVIKSADGTVLFGDHANIGALPALPVIPADQEPKNSFLRSWTLASGLSAYAVSAWANLLSRQEQVQVIIARSTQHREKLLAAYQRKVFFSMGVGALLTALLGYMLVLRGVQPVRAIADQARSITAQRLETRLDTPARSREIYTLVQSFNLMLDGLHTSFQRLSQFSADLAHELRTPINNLMMQTQVVLSQPRSQEDYQALLVSNLEEYERLARMVENMLFLARAEHTQIALNKQMLDVATELQRVADYFEGLAEDAGTRIRVKARGTLIAEPSLFRRAVSNLVANAIRYTPQGGVISLIAIWTNDAIAIKVTNPGDPIDEEHLPKLFDRFYRADQARSDSPSSAGLGLAIVQSIMILHGGRAEVHSTPSGLSTFSLIFPTST